MSQLRAGASRHRRGAMLAAVLAFAGVLSAHTDPKDREPLPNLDRRAERTEATAAAAAATGAAEPARAAAARQARAVKVLSREQGEAQLRRQVQRVVVDRDPVTGTASFVGSPHAFLTGEGGQGGAVPAARLAAISAGERHREVRAFLEERRDLVGHGSEVLGEARVLRDYVTEHNGLRTTVWQQQVEALDVFGATLQAHVTQRGELVNVASRILPDAATAVPAAQRAARAAGGKFSPKLTAAQAVARVAGSLGEPLEETAVVALDEAAGAELRQSFEAEGVHDASARLVWLPLDETQLVLCWEVVATIAHRGEMFRVLVAADDGEVLIRHCLTNYISDASYRVFTSDSPTPGSPGPATPVATQPAPVSRTLVTTPALDTTASPNGWINDGVVETIGNNVAAHTDTNADNLADLPRPQAAGAGRVFDPPLDLTQAPATYRDAAVVNLFYWCNWIHDRLYQLGFTEAAGNFQTNNFGKGGVGNDAVQADAQDGSGTNNANFSTPPDGSPGRMQMFVFTAPTPDRDGDFDHEIVIHEYAHGLSNRLVGGGVGITALQTGGMGEGWGDFYGLALLSEPGDDLAGNYAAGGYATKDFNGQAENYYFGIRRYPYSTNLLKNPLTYRDIDPSQASTHPGIPRSAFVGSAANQVHNMGEVWCVTLWDVRANLISHHGYAVGNELALQLVTDAMKLSPANPTFLQMRDAILQADLVKTGGANQLRIWTAFAKRGMGAGATSPSSNTTTGVVESYSIPDDLLVSPMSVASWTGWIGGPILPGTQAYTLQNIGSSPVNWTVSDNAPWLDLSATSGTLPVSGTTSVVASRNAAANLLGVGSYQATITFTNLANGHTETRSISLVVEPFTVPIFTETFDTGVLTPGYWTLSGTGTYRATVTSASAPHGGSHHLVLDSSDAGTGMNTRAEATLTLDLTGRTGVRLTFWAKIFNDEPNAPSGPITGGADFDGVAISADGTTWYEVQPVRVPDASDTWKKFTVDLDARLAEHGLAYGPNFRIRFNQFDNFPVPTDGIAFDDIQVAYASLNPLALTTLSAVNENAAPVTVTLTTVPAVAADLVVSLASTHPALLGVPASVTVPAGQNSATFSMVPTDDALLNGTRDVTISATAAGWSPASRVIAVVDNESANLSLALPSSAIEGSGALTGTLSVSPAPDAAVAVALFSSHPADLTVPATVIIPAGQASVNFTATIADDNVIDGTVSVSVSAAVAGWSSASASIAIADNEVPAIAIALNGSALREGDTGRSATITFGGVLGSAVSVALSSSDASALLVPVTVTAAAGASSVVVPLGVVDDFLADGMQPVTITGAAPGFATGALITSVADNDAHHFRISPIASPQIRNQPFAVTVTAEDAANQPITNFALTTTLAATSADGAVALTPAALSGWVNGVWTGNWKVASDESAVVVTVGEGAAATPSNAFDVGPGPVHHFTWGPVGPQLVDTPFAVSLTARDAAENVVNFTGAVPLAAIPSATLPIIGSTTLGSDTAPILTQYASSRVSTLYVANELGGPRTFTGFKLYAESTVSLALQNFTVRLKTTPLASFATLAWDNSGWTTVRQGSFSMVGSGWFTVSFTAPYHYDGASNLIVEILFQNAAGGASRNFRFTATAEGRTQWGGHASSVDPLTWSGVSGHASGGVRLGYPSIQWIAAPVTYPVRPDSAAGFVNGVWSGPLSLPVADAAMTLVANPDASGGLPRAESPAFSVTQPQVSDPATVFSDDFESAVLGPKWTVTGTGPYRTQLTSANFPRGGARHLTMDGTTYSSYSRNDAVLTLDLAGRTTVRLKFWGKRWSTAGTAPPAGPFPGTTNFNGVAISSDGVNWHEVQALRGSASLTDWKLYDVDLDAAIAAAGLSYTSTFRIWFCHYGNDYIPYLGLALDDLTVIASQVGVSTSLALPGSLTEGATGVSGTLTLATGPAAATTFALSSSRPAKLAVPATVTVAAGQTSAAFDLTLPDDDLLDGARAVIVQAIAGGYVTALQSTTVADNETAVATLLLPATAREGDGLLSGTLQLDRVSGGSEAYALSSSVPTAATVPPSLVVPPGLSAATFPIRITDDNRIDGPQGTDIAATRAGAPTANGTLVVLDNETTALALSVPAQGVEGTSGTGTVSISGVLPDPLVVTLTSGLPGRVALPSTATIPAGATSATFAVIYVENSAVGDSQSVTLTAAASGFSAASAPTAVRDNDPHHFTFAPIASPQTRGAAFTVTITARTAAEAVLAEFAGPATLSAAGATLGATSLTGWSGGVWTGPVTVTSFGSGITLTVTDGFGSNGTSNSFDVGAGPVDHFAWELIPSPQPTDTNIPVTVRAVDSGDNPVPYSGTAALSAFIPQLVTALNGSSGTLSQPVAGGSALASRTTTIYPAALIGGAGKISTVALSLSSLPSPLSNWTIRLKTTAANEFATDAWDNAGWTTVHASNANFTVSGWVTFPLTTPFDYDGVSNLMVDCSYMNAAPATLSGSVRATHVTVSRTIVGTSTIPGSNPLTWASDSTHSRYLSSYAPNLQLTVAREVPCAPASTPEFVSGVWNGAVSLGGGNGPIFLRAAAPGGLRGDSNSFVVAGGAPLPEFNLFSETWESGAIGAAWTITGAGTYATPRTIVTTNYGARAGMFHLTMDTSNYGYYARNEATVTLNLADRKNVQLSFWAKTWGGSGSIPPSPFTTGADFDGVAISSDGTLWYEVQPLRGAQFPANDVWTRFVVDLDAAIAARGLTHGPGFRIRFNHHYAYPIPNGGLALDEVRVTADFHNATQVTLPASVAEGAGPISAAVQIGVAQAGDTVVTLASSAPTKVAVPPSVIIPAGQTSVSFAPVVLDDSLVDGAKTVSVGAQAAGFNPGRAETLVLDNEVGALSIVVPASTTEGASAMTGTVSLAALASGPLVISLASSDPTAATVPATVTIEAGARSVGFPITVVNDTKIDGTQTTTITAAITGWTPTTGVISVADNESTTLVVSASTVWEGASATGTVSIGGTLPAPVVVSFNSSMVSRVPAPASVTIPAGATSAIFSYTATQNTLNDGNQFGFFQASATGLSSGIGYFTVTDDDLNAFSLSASPASPQLANQSFNAYAYAINVNGTTLPFSGTVALVAKDSTGAVVPSAPASVTFVNGSWSGSLSVNAPATGVTLGLNDGAGHAGVYGPFNVVFGALDHFAVSTVAVPQLVGVPSNVTLTAQDVANNTVPFTGSAALALLKRQTVTGTETGNTVFPIPSGKQTRYQVIYLATELGGSGTITGVSFYANEVSTSGTTNFTIRIKPTSLTQYSTYAWDSTGWSTVTSGAFTLNRKGWIHVPFTTPYVYDGLTHLIFDFCSESLTGISMTGRSSSRTGTRALWLSTSSYPNPTTWSGTTPNPGTTNAVLNLRVNIANTAQLSPATTGAFSNGVWTGPITIDDKAPYALVQVSADSVASLSNAFSVVLPGSLSVAPGNFVLSGPAGGPFAPGSSSLALSNTGDVALTWDATVPSWLDAIPAGGVIAAGGHAVVALQPHSSAGSLPSGIHRGSVALANQTSGLGNTSRTVDLVVTPPGGDSDADGVPDLVEFAMGLNPGQFDAAGQPVVTTMPDPALGLTFTYRRLLNPGNLQYALEGSTDLMTWQPETAIEVVSVTPNPDALTETVVVRLLASVPPGTDAKRFVRLKISVQ